MLHKFLILKKIDNDLVFHKEMFKIQLLHLSNFGVRKVNEDNN